ncbi:MAG: hypothetical protein H8E35_13455 [Ardenticatenia bacterium]|nr:hypothetical protein [Ardenticatenia bacterium]
MRRIVVLLALVSLLSGAAIMVYACERAENLRVSQLFVVPAVHIPSYTVIRPDMLVEKEFSRKLANEPLFVRKEELVGKITTVPLQPGQLVYRSQAVSQATFRLTDDPTLEVLSFPVDPSTSVGGQIQIGQRITIYRLVAVRPQETASTTGLAQDTAAVEVVAENVLVVDVHPGAEMDGEEWSTPAHFLTVAVAHETAVKLIRSAGGQRAEYDLWVSLAPAVSSSLANAGADQIPPITSIATPHIRPGVWND